MSEKVMRSHMKYLVKRILSTSCVFNFCYGSLLPLKISPAFTKSLETCHIL